MSLLRAIVRRSGERRWYDDSVIPSVEHAMWGGAWATSTGISQDTAVRIAAIQSCIALLGDTISTLPTTSYVRSGDARIEQPRPDWMRFPIPDDPNATWEDHVGQLVWSQELDGNSFTLVLPNIADPAALYVLNPQRVTVRKRGVFEVNMPDGRELVGPDQVIHIARNKRAGDLRGFSPAEEAGTTFAMKRAAEVFAKQVFGQGVFLAGQLLVPGPLDKDGIDLLKTEINEQYGGAGNAGKPAVFANGAKWDVPQLDLGAWQLVELHKAAKLDAAGMWRVPPYLIGVTDAGAMAYSSVEAQGIDFAKFSITPRTVRIERAYGRLLPDPINGYLKMSVAALLRGDTKTRAEVEAIYLQNKVLTVDEVRELEDRDPFGDSRGGLLETPNNNAPNGRRITDQQPPTGGARVPLVALPGTASTGR